VGAAVAEREQQPVTPPGTSERVGSAQLVRSSCTEQDLGRKSVPATHGFRERLTPLLHAPMFVGRFAEKAMKRTVGPIGDVFGTHTEGGRVAHEPASASMSASRV
jgi:hypothetical protein